MNYTEFGSNLHDGCKKQQAKYYFNSTIPVVLIQNNILILHPKKNKILC